MKTAQTPTAKLLTSRSVIPAILVAACAVLNGCAIYSGQQFGSNVTDEQKVGIVAGKTTTTDVLRELGNPDQRIDLGKGQEQFSYITSKAPAGIASWNVKMNNTEYWILFENGIVKEAGEKPTTKTPASPFPTSR